MKTVQNNPSLSGLAAAVLAATLFCLPFVNPAHAEESSTGSSAALPVNTQGSYVVDGVLMGDKSLISNEEQILKKFTRF